MARRLKNCHSLTIKAVIPQLIRLENLKIASSVHRYGTRQAGKDDTFFNLEKCQSMWSHVNTLRRIKVLEWPSFRHKMITIRLYLW